MVSIAQLMYAKRLRGDPRNLFIITIGYLIGGSVLIVAFVFQTCHNLIHKVGGQRFIA